MIVATLSDSQVRRSEDAHGNSGNVATNVLCVIKRRDTCTDQMPVKWRDKKFAMQRRHKLSLLCCKLRTNHGLQIKLAKSKIELHLLKFYLTVLIIRKNGQN